MLVDNVFCQDAWNILSTDRKSILIDVRTDFEWKTVGKPKLNHSNQLLLNSLKIYPLMTLNEEFIKILLQETAHKSKKFFLCRYGSRSSTACMLSLANGIKDCYNLFDGFDGNENGPGWKGSNLPIEF